MTDRESSEFKEGYRAFRPGQDPAAHNPYPWSNSEWWRHEAWDKGWNAASQDDDDDDYDDDGPGAGWPSTTGNPSGGGRQNG